MFALASACLAADEAARANLQRAAQSLQQAQELQMQGDMRGASSHYRSALELHAPLRSHWQVLTNYGLTIQPEAPEEAVVACRRRVVELVDDDDVEGIRSELVHTVGERLHGGDHDRPEEEEKRQCHLARKAASACRV